MPLQSVFPFPVVCLRAVSTLNTDLQTLDAEYNKMSELVAGGERDNYDEKLLIKRTSF